ncbi:YceI family protein [Noviluteimonas dokdonensis]
MRHQTASLLAASLLIAAAAMDPPLASAAEVTYEIDPQHTYPSFEADHMGLSHWRGKFNRTSGTVAVDKTAGTGSVEITIDIDSIDYGLDLLNSEALKPEMFDAAKFPKAIYRGKFAKFEGGKPATVLGELTLHGVTRPVELRITRFKCMPHPMNKRDWFGADAEATIDRSQFGIDAGKDYGFDMTVALRIQVEAVAAE